MSRSIKMAIEARLKVGETVSPKDFAALGSSSGRDRALKALQAEGKIKRLRHGKYVVRGLKTQMHGTSLSGRRSLADLVGITFDTKRDTWKTLGYARELSFRLYFQTYQRGDIAQRIVDAPSKATWRNPPEVMDGAGEKGAFAESWLNLLEKMPVYRELERADIRARIGRFGVLVLGFPGDFARAPRSGQPLLYLSSFMENKVEIPRFVTDATSPRFGLPEIYQIDMQGDLAAASLAARKVHFSRVIHIAEDSIEDDIFGKPALEAVFNKLIDLEKVVGGAAESVWKTFDRGLFIKLDKDAVLDEKSLADFDTNVENYEHGLQRIIKGQGMDIESLGAVAADPRGHFQVLASIISGTTGIPQRILFGSERGQLASSMDERNWNARVRERQVTFAEPNILRPLITRFVETKVLPTPEGRLEISWPDLNAQSEAEMLQNTKLFAQAARNMADKTTGLDFLSKAEKRRMLGLAEEMTT